MNIDSLIAQSHQRQFDGEDYQAVAIELASEHGFAHDSEEYQHLESSCGPRCTCTACEQNYAHCDAFGLEE